MNRVLKTAWFATKIGIGGGVVYLTVDQGIWGNSYQATAAYDRLFDIMPGTKSVSEKYLHLPKKDEVNINFRSYWNTGVFYSFDFIANLPSKVANLKDYVIDFASSPPTDDKQSEKLGMMDKSNPVETEASAPLPVSEDAASQEKLAEEGTQN